MRPDRRSRKEGRGPGDRIAGRTEDLAPELLQAIRDAKPGAGSLLADKQLRDMEGTDPGTSTEAEVIFAELQRPHEPGKQAELAHIHRLIAQDNVQVRARFLDDFATLTATELARAAGDDAAPRRWIAERQVFSVAVDGEERFPAFQFTDGRPLPVIGEVLAVLPSVMSAWETAFWFVSSNSWLGGGTPLSYFDRPKWVVAAARHENDEIAG